jgi:EAL domain-containing protein (putative c-di-GMP-specific phosphodiesterase class I)
MFRRCTYPVGMREFPHAQFERKMPWPDTRLAGSGALSEVSGGPLSVDDQVGWRFLVLTGIENFDVLRRKLGRQGLDMLIVDVAARIGEILPDAQITVSGRDIVEIGFESDARAALDVVIAGLEVAFAAPFEIDGALHSVHVEFGATAALSTDGCDEINLIEEAEHALAEARRERIAISRDVTGIAVSIDRTDLARDLTAAIDNEEMFLQYQPKVHLRRQEISSVEALIRWKHPKRGLVQPNDFVPLAEQSLDIAALTLWTIRRSIRDQKTLAAQGHEVRVFINIAGILLADTRFVRQACILVENSGARLGFEITETSVIRDPESAIANLKIFAEIGVVIAIDDYGAGLSSLAYLKQLPARELKIDKLFITHLTSSNRDPLIVRSTIDLAHALEMEVVAEGVETHAAMALLSVMGCDMIQGFLISRPVDLDALIQFLADEKHLAIAAEVRAPFNRLATVLKRG